MYPVQSKCPICGEIMTVTQLHCRSCDTRIEGQFSLGRMAELSPEQLEFVELFIRCEGKLSRMQQEMGLSYPAVRSRLTDVIRTMGYEIEEAPAMPGPERKAILSDLAEGRLDPDEALELLRSNE
jgi:hypothetical protein